MLKTTHLYLFYSYKAIIKCNNYPSLCLGIKNRFDGSMEKPSVLVQIKMAANPSSLFFFHLVKCHHLRAATKRKNTVVMCAGLCLPISTLPKKKTLKCLIPFFFFQQISI